MASEVIIDATLQDAYATETIHRAITNQGLGIPVFDNLPTVEVGGQRRSAIKVSLDADGQEATIKEAIRRAGLTVLEGAREVSERV